MQDGAHRAIEIWDTIVTPYPIGSDVLFMLYFKHREHPFKFFYRQYKSLYDANQERKRLGRDLLAMRNDKFMEKYQIGYRLKESIL